MGCTLGIDVGSTTAKAVVLSSEGRVLHRVCERHRGRPREVALRLAAGARSEHAPRITGVTGSIGVTLAAELEASAVHEVRAVVRAVRSLAAGTRTVVELGGQDAKLVFLGEGEDAQLNDRCAAGTGATIDRIVRRLEIDPRELASARMTGSLRVASRCGVFAETDVVNLVKRGATREDALSALARAIVTQNLSVLARARVVRPPVLLLGGPHAHLPILADAWREELASLWRAHGAPPGEVIVPLDAELHAAIGAALHAQAGAPSMPRLGRILESTRARGALLDGPIDLHSVRCAPPVARPIRDASVHLGIDAGSTTSKAVLLAADGALVASVYRPSAGNPVDDARECLAALEAQVGPFHPRSLGVTGYGAELVAAALGADEAPVETLAHAVAAHAHAPDADVVVDVGGTDAKILLLDGERVRGFHVSNQCAAGHGAFLAASARELGVSLDEIAERALRARRAPLFTVGCSVFVDTDRVTFQRDGFDADEILAGLCLSLVRNVWEYVVPEPPGRLGHRFVLTGGAHRNLAVAIAHSRYLTTRVVGARVSVHPHPELCGAIGAALLGARATPERSRFVGLGAARRVRIDVRTGHDTRCTRCELECPRSFLAVESDRARTELVVGNACERGADVGSTAKRTRAHAPDLLAEEASRLFRPLVPTRAARRSKIVLGIPRVMALYRAAPLLLHYLRAGGVPDDHLVLSPPTSAELLASSTRGGVHDPCFPSKLVLAHVDWLLRREPRIDVLLMPALTHARIEVHGTADTASCPIVAASGHASVAALRRDGDVLASLGVRAMTPELCLVDPRRLEAQLFEAFGSLLGLRREESRDAMAHGLRAQQTFAERCRRRGAKVLADARARGRAVAVVLARPYHADPGVQHGVSTELTARGVPVLGISSLPLDSSEDLSDLLPEVTNSGASERVWAARRVTRDRHLVAVDLSSFRCGQDASIAGLVDDLLRAADRPALRLHDLDEDRPGASLALRIDTFVATVRAYERRRLCRRELRIGEGGW